ncbi:MAG: hypothetical protein H6R18_1440 [Proteobacteria bacterium]|nr:hypothetical protein [Pseudomonadota bacterium]
MVDTPQKPGKNEILRELGRGADSEACFVGGAVNTDDALVHAVGSRGSDFTSMPQVVASSEATQTPPPMPPGLVDFIGAQRGAAIAPGKLKAEADKQAVERSNFCLIAAGIGLVLMIVATAGIYLIKRDMARPDKVTSSRAVSVAAGAKDTNGPPAAPATKRETIVKNP